jgi:hypothetical protein
MKILTPKNLTLVKDVTPFEAFCLVYNTRGEHIAALLNEELSPGQHSVHWNAGDLPSGVYLYKIIAGDFVQTRKMLLIK